MGKGKDGDKTEGETYPDLRYGPLNYSIANLQSYLSPEQKDLLQQFRDSIPTIYPETLTGVEELFLTDGTLCRYLRAREWNLSKAQKMLLETLKWRREYKPWAITGAEVDGEMNNLGKMYRSGYDKHNRPILIMKPRHDNTHGSSLRDVKVRYLVYCLEKCIRAGDEIYRLLTISVMWFCDVLFSLENDREKIGLLIDFSKNSGGFSNVGMALEVLKILTDHYPERLGTAWIIGASWSFTLFWKAISPFLDSVTKKKIFFINKLAEFKEWIDDDVLEVEYGGTNDFVYSYEAYREREDGFFPPHNEAGELVHVVARPDAKEEEDAAEDGEDKPKKKKSKKGSKKHHKSAHNHGDEEGETLASSRAQDEDGESTEEPSASASAHDASTASAADQDADDTDGDAEKEKKSKKKSKHSKAPSSDATAEEQDASASNDTSSTSKTKKTKKNKPAEEVEA